MWFIASRLIYIRVSIFSSRLLVIMPYKCDSFGLARSSSQRDICTRIFWNTKIFPVETHLPLEESYEYRTILFKLRLTYNVGLWFCVFCNDRLHTFWEDAPMFVLIRSCLKILLRINQKILLRCQCEIERWIWQAAYLSIMHKAIKHWYLETAGKMIWGLLICLKNLVHKMVRKSVL